MKDLGEWSVSVESGRVYFKYREHHMGQFSGSEYNARYMADCINAALRCWSSIDDWVEADADTPPGPVSAGGEDR